MSFFEKLKMFYKKHTILIWIVIIVFVLLSGIGDRILYHFDPIEATKNFYLVDPNTGEKSETVGEFASEVGGTFTKVKLNDGTYNVLFDYKTYMYTSTFTFHVDAFKNSDDMVTITSAISTDNFSKDVYSSMKESECNNGLFASMKNYGSHK